MDCRTKYPYLWELSGGKTGFIKVMLMTFVQSSDEYKKELELSIQGGEKDISLIAHKLKSAMKIVGANELSMELERLQNSPDKSVIPSVMDGLDTVVNSIRKDIEML